MMRNPDVRWRKDEDGYPSPTTPTASDKRTDILIVGVAKTQREREGYTEVENPNYM